MAVYHERVENMTLMRDEELALLVQQGDTERFGVLVERYEAKLLRYGRKFLSRKEDIEDMVQEIFLRAYENIMGFDASQRFSPWLYRLAHNVFVNALRKESRNPLVLVDFDVFFPHPAYDDPAEKERERLEMRALIERGLERISPNYREALILYYLDEMSYREIADVLRVPSSTVGIRLKRGKEALRRAYGDLDISL